MHRSRRQIRRTHASLGLVSSRLPLVVWLLTLGCGGPFLMIPGGALSGTVVEEPVADWSFASDAFVDVETRPSDPYSVELNYVVRDGALYIDPAEGRKWFDHLRENPNLRVRFGDRIYPVEAVLVGRPGELEGFDPDRYVYRLDSRPARRGDGDGDGDESS